MGSTLSKSPLTYQESFPGVTNLFLERSTSTSSWTLGTVLQQQGRSYIPSSSETAEVTGYRRSTGYFVPGVLQSPLLRTQTQWLLLPYHGSQGPEPVPGGTVFQDANPVLDSSSVSNPGMDDQNRFEGCLPTYHSTSKYLQVLPACGKLSDLPVQGTSIWPLYSTQGVYKDSGTCSTASWVLGYTDSSNLNWIFRASSPLQTQPHGQRTLQLSKTLGWTVNWDKCLLAPSKQVDFLGLHFNLLQSVVTSPECHTSMSNSYSGTIPVCQTYFVNNQLNLSLRSIYSSGTNSTLLSLVWAKFPWETSTSDLWTPIGTGSGVPVSSPMVHLFQDNQRSSPTESRTGPVLFHGRLSDRMVSQLERLPHLGILDYRAPGVPHKLVRDGSSQTGGSPLGFPVARSNTPPVLRQQHDSCLHSETGGTIFRDSVHRNSGTVKPIGSS